MPNSLNRYPRPLPVRLGQASAVPANAGLRSLVREYRDRALLLSLAQQALDSTAAYHLLGAAQEGDAVLLTFDDAAWLTRARYAQPRLLARLNGEGRPVRVRRIRFLVRSRPGPAATRPRARLSRLLPGAGQIIRDASRGIQDPELRSALQRLASRAHS